MNDVPDRWMAFAALDVRAAEVTLGAGLTAQACFHAHQAVEKALKALIQHATGHAAPRVHGLGELLGNLPALQRSRLADAVLPELDDYYIPTRYPDAIPGTLAEGLPDQARAAEAVQCARDVVRIAADLLHHAGNG